MKIIREYHQRLKIHKETGMSQSNITDLEMGKEK